MFSGWLGGLLVAAFLTNIAMFAKALPSFARPEGVPLRMRALSAVGFAATLADLWALWFFPADLLRSLGALALIILSAWLFNSAFKVARRHRFSIAFTTIGPAAIIVEGPYRWLRHPIYVSYSLTWGAAICGSHSWVPLLAGATMACFYIAAARQEDAALAHLAGRGSPDVR